MKRFPIAFLAFILCPALAVAEMPADPLDSPMWKQLSKQYFGDAKVEFDSRVKVVVPTIVENQAQVPIVADARGLEKVTKVLVFADLNPIQKVLTLTPRQAAPYISFRMKIEQATPVRAAALTEDGVWHVGGVFLNADGGGCTAPAKARIEVSWYDTLGQAQGRTWRETDGLVRTRFRIRHPMDTGLAKDNTPAYFIERAEVKSASGKSLATLEMFEPVSEDPTLTLLVGLPNGEAYLDIDGRDNNGGIYSAHIPAPWRQSSLEKPGKVCSATSPC